MSLALHVDGRPVRSHSPIVQETLASGGCGVASWTMSTARTELGVDVREGMQAVVSFQGVPTWSGRIESFDRSSGGVRGRGLWGDAAGVPAIDGARDSTFDVGEAAEALRTFGVPIRPPSVSGVLVGEPSTPLMVDDLLSRFAVQEHSRAGVDANRELFVRPIQSEPKWMISGANLQISGANLDRPNHLTLRYFDMDGVLRTTFTDAILLGWHFVFSSRPVDLTDRGKMTELQARSIGDEILAATSPEVPLWMGSIEVDISQIRTIGGAKLTSPYGIEGGDVVQLANINAGQFSQVGATYLNVELGRVVTTSGSPKVTLEAANTMPTSLEDAIRLVASR